MAEVSAQRRAIKLSPDTVRVLDVLCRLGWATARELGDELNTIPPVSRLNVLMKHHLAWVSTHTQVWTATAAGHELRRQLLEASRG